MPWHAECEPFCSPAPTWDFQVIGENASTAVVTGSENKGAFHFPLIRRHSPGKKVEKTPDVKRETKK